MTAHAKISSDIALLSAQDYERMIGAGILAGRQVELRDGLLIEMPPEYSPHAALKTDLGFTLMESLRRIGRNDLRAIIDVSVATGPQDVPEPDVVVVRRDAATGLLAANAVLLAIEVAASSRTHDLGWKTVRYATAEIAEYWVVDVKASVVHRHRQPSDGEYGIVEVVRFDELLRSTAIDGLEVRIGDLVA